MTLLYAVCAWFTWVPATNAVEYDVYLDDIFYETVLEEVELCSTGNYIDHIIFVVGIGAVEQEGPDSNDYEFMWVPDFDRDENFSVGFSDFGAFAAVFSSDRPSDLWADADGDGVVGFSDFGKFVQRFGKCNNGIREVPCG